MDWLLDHLDALRETVFFAVADLLSLDVDQIFFDTTSTYFENEFADGELDGTDTGLRQRGHSKDSRPDLPQVVIGMARHRRATPRGRLLLLHPLRRDRPAPGARPPLAHHPPPPGRRARLPDPLAQAAADLPRGLRHLRRAHPVDCAGRGVVACGGAGGCGDVGGQR
jgi:hypothetical protein